MAHPVEPMDLDSIDTDFDNKENSLCHINMLQCTEKGYEELDVSELNMKLRYSLTPTSSPMSQSCTFSVNKRNLDTEEFLNSSVNESHLTMSLNSNTPRNDNANKIKSLPLQSLPKLSQQLDSDVSKENITVIVSGNDDECLSTTSSAVPTPETITPTTDIPKNDGGSPIMRGLKSVLNMFRGSTSPIPPTEYDNHSLKTPVVSPSDNFSTTQDKNKENKVTVSTPIITHKNKDGGSKRCSPLKDSIIFKDEIEKELQWKDETTVLFSPEKIPIHKLILQHPKQLPNKSAATDCDHLNTTVEHMDISYNNSQIDKSNDIIDSDGEFVDCETTFTKESPVKCLLQKEDITVYKDVEGPNDNATMGHLVKQASEVLLNVTVPKEKSNIDNDNILASKNISSNSIEVTNESLNFVTPIETVYVSREPGVIKNMSSENINLTMVSTTSEICYIQNDSMAELEVSLDSIEMKQDLCNYFKNPGESQTVVPELIDNTLKLGYSNIIDDNSKLPVILHSINTEKTVDSLATNYELDSLEINNVNDYVHDSINILPVQNEYCNYNPRKDTKSCNQNVSPSVAVEEFIYGPVRNINTTQRLHEFAHEIPLPDDDDIENDLNLCETDKINVTNIKIAAIDNDGILKDVAVNEDILMDSITLDEHFNIHTQVNLNNTDLSQILNDIDSILKSDEANCLKSDKVKYISVNSFEHENQKATVHEEIDKSEEHYDTLNHSKSSIKYDCTNSTIDENRTSSALSTSIYLTSTQKTNNKNMQSLPLQLPNDGTTLEMQKDDNVKSVSTTANEPSNTSSLKPMNIIGNEAVTYIELDDGITVNSEDFICEDAFNEVDLTNMTKLKTGKTQDCEKLMSMTLDDNKKQSDIVEIMDMVKESTAKDKNFVNISKNLDLPQLDPMDIKLNVAVNKDQDNENMIKLPEFINAVTDEMKFDVIHQNSCDKMEGIQMKVDSNVSFTNEYNLCNIDNKTANESVMLTVEHSNPNDMTKSNIYDNNVTTTFLSEADVVERTFEKESLDVKVSNIKKVLIVDQSPEDIEQPNHILDTKSLFIDNITLLEQEQAEKNYNHDTIREVERNQPNIQLLPELNKCIDGEEKCLIKGVQQIYQSSLVSQESEKSHVIDDDIAIYGKTTPLLSMTLNLDIVSENKISQQKNEINKEYETKNIIEGGPPYSPPIVSKGYSYNFEEVDDPFATKIILRQSPEDTFLPLEPVLNEQIEQMNTYETKILDNINNKMDYTKLIVENNIESSETDTNRTAILNTATTSMEPEADKDEITNDTNLVFGTNTETIEYKHSNNDYTVSDVLPNFKTSSADEASLDNSSKCKNVFNIPELSGNNFNPFATRSRIASSPETSIYDYGNSTIVNVQTKTLVDKTDTEPMEKESIENISSESCSSQITDKNTTAKEIHTEDEDTVEGPFFDGDHSVDRIYDSDDEPVDTVKCSDISHEQENRELFIDAEAFEFLLNQNKTNIVTDSGKESLFLKFDPLFAKRLSSDGVFAALSKIQRRQSTPSKLATLKKEIKHALPGPSNINSTFVTEPQLTTDTLNEDQFTSLSKPMMAVSPAVNPVPLPRKSITPTRTNRRSFTFTSPAIAVIDNLLSMSANSSLLDQEPTRQSETLLYLTECNERLAEKQMEVYNQRAENIQLKERLDTMEIQIKALEQESQERLKKVNEWNDTLAEKSKTNKCMESVVEEYERTIASLVAEIEQNRKQHAEERIMLISERDEQRSYLASVELSFNDILNKFDKHKQLVITHKTNEDSYKKSIEKFEENVSKMQKNYDLLKQHATSKLSHVNQELEKMNLIQEAEVLKLNTKLKRVEMCIKSLEDSLAQKTKANEELTAICEELINKIKHN